MAEHFLKWGWPKFIKQHKSVSWVIFAAMKILMVCLGNICRSPLAEGILKQKIAGAGLDWTIDSAGTGDYHIGQTPHHLSRKVAMLNGIDISCQKARQFQKKDITLFDKIYVMDSQNYQAVKHICQEQWDEEKVDLLLNAVYPGKNINVPDPWFGTEEGYHKVFTMIDEACLRIVEKYAGFVKS